MCAESCSLFCIGGLAVAAVLLVWPLSVQGYRFYAGLVEAENEKHAKQGPGH